MNTREDISQLVELVSEIRWKIQDEQVPRAEMLPLAAELSKVGIELNKMIRELIEGFSAGSTN